MKKWQKEFLNLLLENKINFSKEEHNTYVEKYIPKKLYKYAQFDSKGYSLENLKYNRLFLNTPSSYNDPYDCSICYLFDEDVRDLSIEVIENSCNLLVKEKEKIIDKLLNGDSIFAMRKRFCRNEELTGEFDFIIEEIQEAANDQFIKNIQKYLNNYVKVSCFSKRHDNILMWSHYAKNHTGFCIEYDLGHSDFKPFKNNIYPVFYSDKPIKKFENNSDFSEFLSFFLATTTKFKDWSYEKEWRFLSFYSKENFFTMPCKPSAIYLGAKISTRNRNKIVKLCKELNISCRKMVQRADSFYVQPSIYQEG